MSLITALGLATLQKKLVDLKEELRETYDKRAAAAAEGDLKENSAYIFAGEHAHLLNSQIEDVVLAIKESKIAKPPLQSNIIEFGHQVKVHFQTDNREMEMILVGKHDARLKPNWISVESPIGQAVLGKKVGDTVDVNGQPVKILNISIPSLE